MGEREEKTASEGAGDVGILEVNEDVLLRDLPDNGVRYTLELLFIVPSPLSPSVLEHFRKRDLARENPVVASIFPTTRIVLFDVVFFFHVVFFRQERVFSAL